MDSYVDKINRMTFRELRDELSLSSDNPVKNLLIRKLMKKKYLEYKKRKEDAMKSKVIKPKKQLKNKGASDEISIRLANELLDDIQRNDGDDIMEIVGEFNENDFKMHGPLNDLDPRARLYDKKFAGEIERDQLNNSLMNRMNSDIYIQDMRKNKRKTFETPFSNEPDEKHAPYHNDPTIIPGDDFTTKSRFI